MTAGAFLSGFSEILSGWTAREAGKAQSKALREQSRQAWYESSAAEQAQRRAARRAFGELRASGSQAGVAGSVTFGDVYAQSAAEAELDALNIRYQGVTARQGLLFDSKVANAARPKWGEIAISAGARALTGGTGSGWRKQAPAPVETSVPTYTRKS
jgi:hypothetical protein